MDLLQYCADLNKEGAAMLAADNSFAAFEYFRNALQIVVLGIPNGNEILKSCPALGKASSSLLLEPTTFHWLLWSPQTMNQPPHDPHRSTNTFNKAFVFQPNEDGERELDLRIRTYIALIIFNVAATIHQRSAALPREQQCDQALTVALELYDVGFDLLIQEESCCVDDWSTNISLAILNNMAEVHWTLSDFNKASRVLELQKSLLEILFSNKRPHNFSDQEMEVFILNTHLLQAPSGAGAA
ncbi:expressed unknown protein [Seminavis robusta]|uniref:Uncharacterized protein n=1 Tax=Seminavis robusta TaxID=568900 RepID=A0A9N8E6M9_9STRA|nr:expressed unknown protein [Seminavis robusta]|eukprot:Sro677_g185880.1 n/a (242) ;mRNA; r:47187-47912